MKRLKILIDARWYGLEQRGIGRYAKELIDGLAKKQNDFDFVLIVSKQNFHLVPKDLKKIIAKSRWYSLFEQIEIPWIIEKVKPDYFHALHINVPLFCQVPYLLTVHDLQLLKVPNQRATTLPKPFFIIKTLMAKFLITSAIKNAERIIAVSKFTADEIVLMVKGPLPKIDVIWEGTSFMPQKNYRPNLLHNLKIYKKFFVYCGAAYPHKNLELLINAFIRFNENNKSQYQLVLVGRTDYFYSRLQAEHQYNDVIFTGYLSDNDVANLYKNCYTFVIASNYEGFGLSPLEAQSCGAPVIAAEAGSLPEVLADSALLFNPENQNNLVEAFTKFINSQDLAEQLSKKGLINFKRFSWTKMVDEICDLYKQLK